LKGNEKDLVRKHPLFWAYSEKLDFLHRIGDVLTNGTDRQKAIRLESRKNAIFDTNWQNSFKRDKRGQAFIREEIARRRIIGETESLKSLIAFVRKKLRHVCETARAAGIEITDGQKLDLAVFDFVTSPFPRLFLETYSELI
jgi:hypothetical protein